MCDVTQVNLPQFLEIKLLLGSSEYPTLFQEQLNPDESTLSQLALKLNILIQNVTEGFEPALRRGGGGNTTSTEDGEIQNSTMLTSKEPEAVTSDDSVS